jgi:ribosome-associated protein
MATIPITETIAIPEGELRFTASRSAGPGGQHVNKVSSRITLHFDLDACDHLDEPQKERIHQQLHTRINKNGILRVSSQRHRSQAANRVAATERFADLLRQALWEDKERRPTRIPRKVNRRRLEEKRKRAQQKRSRGNIEPWD